MIAGMIAYKWAVKGSRWGTAAIFGLLVYLVNLGINYLGESIIGNATMLVNWAISYFILGVSAFLMARYYKKFNQKKAIDIGVKTIIVAVVIGLLLLALLGYMFISILGMSSAI